MKEVAGSPNEHDETDARKPAHDPEGAGGADALQPEVQDRIGEKLREVYSDVMNEPVPDRFLELLEKLDKKGSSGSGGTSAGGDA